MAGRKNYYELYIEPNLQNIKHWLIEGYSHEQICEMIHVSKTTFYKYQEEGKSHFKSEFAEVMRAGTAELGVRLETALYKEAIGFEYEENHVEVKRDHFGDSYKERKVKKYARSNASLLIFALCNKFPKKWRRVDKDVIDAIEEGKVKLDVTDKHIKDAFKALYPAIEDEEAEKIIEKSSKYKADEEDENKNKS